MSDASTPDLLERIEAFALDDPRAQAPFTSRLAREQGWTHAYAARAIREYKRFIALAAVSGHPVSPPEVVDQVWHLHLVYTKSYWHDLCRDLLGRELHHAPSTGSTEESAKFTDWYARTLESYARVFKEDPPADIWPRPGRGGDHGGPKRWVDLSRWVLLPRPPGPRRGWFKRLFRRNNANPQSL